MSINYEMARYTELTGEDGTKVSISRLGGYLDGYMKGRADAIDECMQYILKIMPSEPFLKSGKHYENWKMKTTELRMLRDMLEELKEKKNGE